MKRSMASPGIVIHFNNMRENPDTLLPISKQREYVSARIFLFRVIEYDCNHQFKGIVVFQHLTTLFQQRKEDVPMESVDAPSINRKKAAPKRTRSQTKTAGMQTNLQARIEVNAYYKAQARGFAPGYALEDWLAAEKEET